MGLKFNLDNRSPGVISYQDKEVAYFCIPDENNGEIYAFIIGVNNGNDWVSFSENWSDDSELSNILEQICDDKGIDTAFYLDFSIKSFKLDDETKSLLKKVFDYQSPCVSHEVI